MSTNYNTFNNQEVTECPICLESVDIEHGVYTFLCGHKIHTDCTEKYIEYTLQTSNNNSDIKCPVCRSSLLLQNNSSFPILNVSFTMIIILSSYYMLLLLIQKYLLS